MEKYLKLQGDKKLEVRFTPRTMARFQRSTKKSMGYFMQLVQILSGFIKANEMTPADQAKALNAIGYEDLKLMILAGCPEVKTLDEADLLLDELEESIFVNIAMLIEAFSIFMNGNVLQEAETKPNPTQPKKPKKQKGKATNPAA